jgi:hypothetical protein
MAAVRIMESEKTVSTELTESEATLLSTAILTMMEQNNKASVMITNCEAREALEYENKELKALNDKVLKAWMERRN